MLSSYLPSQEIKTCWLMGGGGGGGGGVSDTTSNFASNVAIAYVRRSAAAAQ